MININVVSCVHNNLHLSTKFVYWYQHYICILVPALNLYIGTLIIVIKFIL